jgi:hypothetical protein
VLDCKILAKNFADGQGRTGKRVLYMANEQFKIWKLGKKLSEELNKTGLGYIWHDPKENSVDRLCKMKDAERQNLFANIKEKKPLINIYEI